MTTANIFVKKDHVAKDGTIPIYLRLTVDRKVHPPIKLGQRTKPEHWDSNIGRVTQSHPNFIKLNQLLNQIQRKADDVILDHQLTSRVITYESFCREFSGLSPYDFYFLVDKFIISKHGSSDGYLEKIRFVVKKLKEKYPTLNLHSINYQFVVDYVNYLRKERGNNQNTINTNIKILRRIMSHGIRLKLVKENAFLDYKLKHVVTEQPVLSLEEVRKYEGLLTTDFSDDNKELRAVLCWFLLSVYTGRRFDDLKNFKSWTFTADQIKLRQMKRTAGREENKTITLFMNTRIREMVAEILANEYKLGSNQKANKALKKLNLMAGIFTKNITFHSGRHTFATINKSLTDDLTVRRDLLGHDSIKSTLIYDHPDQDKLNTIMKKWDHI